MSRRTRRTPYAGAADAPGVARFAALELLVWASLYPAYLAVRGWTISEPDDALEHATRLVELERSLELFHEASLQRLVSFGSEFFSAYYMLGFGPLLAGMLVWLGLRSPERYRELRTLLLVSLAIAVIGHVLYPTAPPRLVPSLAIADTVGLSGREAGSFAGIQFNPYAAMPSMHVGWSLLAGLTGYRAARQRFAKMLFALHPLLMAVAVTATGNHYFVDSIAGAAVAVAALAALGGLRWARSPHTARAHIAFSFPGAPRKEKQSIKCLVRAAALALATVAVVTAAVAPVASARPTEAAADDHSVAGTEMKFALSATLASRHVHEEGTYPCICPVPRHTAQTRRAPPAFGDCARDQDCTHWDGRRTTGDAAASSSRGTPAVDHRDDPRGSVLLRPRHRSWGDRHGDREASHGGVTVRVSPSSRRSAARPQYLPIVGDRVIGARLSPAGPHVEGEPGPHRNRWPLPGGRRHDDPRPRHGGLAVEREALR